MPMRNRISSSLMSSYTVSLLHPMPQSLLEPGMRGFKEPGPHGVPGRKGTLQPCYGLQGAVAQGYRRALESTAARSRCGWMYRLLPSEDL